MKLLIIRTRAAPQQSRFVEETLKRLSLDRTIAFTIREDSPALQGMLEKVKHLTTWGPINSALEKKLSTLKKGLHPPRGGFERKGIKTPYSRGGVYGNRADKINELAEKMIP